MSRTLAKLVAVIVLAMLTFVACGGSEQEQPEPAAEREAEEVEEDTAEEPAEEAEEEESPENESCPRPPRGTSNPRPALARVMKGEVVPLNRKGCFLQGTVTMVRLPGEQGRTAFSFDGLGGLEEDAGYEAFLHTGSCKQDGGRPFLINAKKPARPENQIGGQFGVEDGLEFETPGFAGKEVASVVIYQDGRPLACANLGPAE